MKILKNGDPRKADRTLSFECKECGCVFEANQNEYMTATIWDQMHDNVEAKCKCPCCGRRVERFFGEEPKE